MKKNSGFINVIFVFLIVGQSVYAQEKISVESPGSPDDLVKKLYEYVSVEKGEAYDWDRVRTLFHEQASVVLRTSMTESTVFTVEGFIDDFKKFVSEYSIINTGFTEKIAKMKSTVLGDIAHIFVVYQAGLPGSDRFQTGLDSMHLIYVSGEWKIISIINEIPTLDRPLPEFLGN